MNPQVGKLGTRPTRSSALLSAKRVRCAPAFPSPLGGSRFLVSGISERRPDTQIALPVRLRADEAVAKCFGFLARSELGDDLPCQTVDDDEILQGAGLSRRTHQTPTSDANQEGRPNVGIDANEGSCRRSARLRQPQSISTASASCGETGGARSGDARTACSCAARPSEVGPGQLERVKALGKVSSRQRTAEGRPTRI